MNTTIECNAGYACVPNPKSTCIVSIPTPKEREFVVGDSVLIVRDEQEGTVVMRAKSNGYVSQVKVEYKGWFGTNTKWVSAYDLCLILEAK